MSLYERPQNFVVVNGKKYNLSMYFNRVLFVLCKVYPSPDITPEDKAAAMLNLLVSSKHKFSIELFDAVTNLISSRSETNEKFFDFEQDADIIFASFMQAYSIDLNEQHDKMQWKTFLALLQGLPKSTPFSQTIELRAKPIPARTKENANQIAALQKAKAKVALKLSEQEKTDKLAKGFNELFDALKINAEKG